MSTGSETRLRASPLQQSCRIACVSFQTRSCRSVHWGRDRFWPIRFLAILIWPFLDNPFFGQSIFSHRVLGPTNFGQIHFWPNPFLANPPLANLILAQIGVLVFSQSVRPRKVGGQTQKKWGLEGWGARRAGWGPRRGPRRVGARTVGA